MQQILKSLMIGAAVNWAGAIAMFVNKDFRYDMLIMAIAIFIGYIIPGIIMWSNIKNKQSTIIKCPLLTYGI